MEQVAFGAVIGIFALFLSFYIVLASSSRPAKFKEPPKEDGQDNLGV